MKNIANKTHSPLRLALPNGRTLHLGPSRTGQISAHDVDHPRLDKLVRDGKVEIFIQAGNPAIPAGGFRSDPWPGIEMIVPMKRYFHGARGVPLP